MAVQKCQDVEYGGNAAGTNRLKENGQTIRQGCTGGAVVVRHTRELQGLSLDLSPLDNATAQLVEALDLCGSEIVRDNPKLKKHLRAASIKAFELTYMVSLKTLRLYMMHDADDPSEIRQMSFNDFIRRAYGRHLARSGLAAWRRHRERRDMASRAYDESREREIFEGAPDFLDEARHLLGRLQERSAGPVAINPDHLRTVWKILRETLPPGVRVWVIGSRASWTSKDSSDLDLVLEGDSALDPGMIVALVAAFEGSDIPYEVDVMDINKLANSFRRIMEAQRVLLPDES